MVKSSVVPGLQARKGRIIGTREASQHGFLEGGPGSRSVRDGGLSGQIGLHLGSLDAGPGAATAEAIGCSRAAHILLIPLPVPLGRFANRPYALPGPLLLPTLHDQPQLTVIGKARVIRQPRDFEGAQLDFACG